MKTKLILILGLASLLLSAGNARATIITIEIEGVVGYVMDFNNLLEGQITSGMTFTGSYTYNSDTPDSEPDDPTGGNYWHYTQPYGISININNFIFETDPQDVIFCIGIVNGSISDNNDGYIVSSANNANLANGEPITEVFWQLDNYAGTAISSDSLPLTAPILNDWKDGNYLLIKGGERSEEFFIGGTVTSAMLIPEPTSIAILLLGTILTRKRFKKS